MKETVGASSKANENELGEKSAPLLLTSITTSVPEENPGVVQSMSVDVMYCCLPDIFLLLPKLKATAAEGLNHSPLTTIKVPPLAGPVDGSTAETKVSARYSK